VKENQRVRISKKLMRESLVRLLAQKSIHKISVREICDGAEINRTTFYKYYGSQYDLLRDMENEVLAQIDSGLGGIGENGGEDVRRLAGIFAYLHDNLDLCRLLINNTVDSEFPEKLLNLPMIRRLLSEQLVGEYRGDESDYVYQFVVNGGFSIIKRWINKESRESPEMIARVLISTVYRLFPEKSGCQ
jgi:AcrR family transcriptional regulator